MTESIIIISFFIFAAVLIAYDKISKKKYFGTIVIDETDENGPYIFLEINDENWKEMVKNNDLVLLKVRIRK